MEYLLFYDKLPCTVFRGMMTDTEHEECADIMFLPVRLKLRVSFSPLHGDNNYSVQNKETGTRYGVVRKEQGNGER